MDVTCACGTTFTAKDRRAKWCSDRCRKRGQRGGEVVSLPTEPKAEKPGPVETQAHRELSDAGRLDSSIGQACLVLARRLDRPGVDTGSALSTVAARLEDLMAKATRAAGASAPQQYRDELAARRARHA